MLVVKNTSVFYLYFYLLIFSIINRSFAPFDIDLRYIILLLGCISVFMLFIKKNIQVKYPCRTINIAVLLLYVFVIQGFWNIAVQIVEYDVYKNVIILNLYNIFNIIVISVYYRILNIMLIYKAMKLALIFLGLSILISFCGMDLPYNSYHSFSMTGELSDFARYCGYGTDPNYVSMFFVCFIFIAYDCMEKKRNIIPIIVGCLFFVALSRSTTVIVVTILCILVRYMYKLLRGNPKIFILTLLLILFGTVFTFLEFRIFDTSISLSIRYGLWNRAFVHFTEHPWLGNGITSVRNFAYLSESRWFVQVHSTFFQILCEHGVIALGLYFYIFYRLLYEYLGMATFYMIFIYFIWSFTYETMYLGFPIIFFAVLPCCVRKFNGEVSIEDEKKCSSILY